ncbi:MAG: LysR family transcriptional regulator [Syntrophobacteraceae bacterium]|nr:LysR family transcriptional regulator [Desulfobacteraceae bacterium]
MIEETPKFNIKSKIWIEDENGEVVFGAGRLRILDAVERSGSIQAAAQELQMSYRAVWGKIKATEQRLGTPMLSRKAGGAEGGGSELTPIAKELVARFRQLRDSTNSAADDLFLDFFSLEIQGESTGADLSPE